MPQQAASTTKWRTNKALWANQLNRLVELCGADGLTVTFVKGAEDQIDGNVITINSTRSKKSQFNCLIHELGHSILDRTFKFDCRSAHIYARMNAAHNTSCNTLAKQVSLLESEMLAWHYGELAAIKNELIIDHISFDAFKARCLKSYVQTSPALCIVGSQHTTRQKTSKQRTGKTK